MTTSPASRRIGFLDLPQELRNVIYELSLRTLADTQDIVPLFTEPPSRSLIFSCKQTAREARAMYQDAYQRFWSTTHFEVRQYGQQEPKALVQRLRSRDVAAISRLTIVCSCFDDWRIESDCKETIEFDRGLWKPMSPGDESAKLTYSFSTRGNFGFRAPDWLFWAHMCIRDGGRLPVIAWVSGDVTDPEKRKRIIDACGWTALRKEELVKWLLWNPHGNQSWF